MKNRPKSNNELVFDTIKRSAKSLTAYDILAQLRKFGISGPPTVYRALEKLIKDGRVHRIQALNSFIACHKEADCTHTHHNTFTVCKDCGTVEEIHDDRVASLIESLSRTRKFHVQQESFELVGQCHDCAAPSGEPR